MKKILLVAFLMLGLFAAGFSLRVREIELSPNICLGEPPQRLEGKLIFMVNDDDESEKLKNSYQCISEVVFKKVYPSKIKIEIKEQAPVAQIASTNFSAASNGLVVENSRANLPQLFLPDSVKIAAGATIEDKLALSAIKIASLITKSDFRATNIRLLDTNDIAVYDASGAVVIFSGSKPEEEQVDSLQQVIALAKISDDKITKIDLRFEKPVIK